MARKKKHEEHENHERWLVSYADFITLLFAFFVVMYSMSSVNEGKYRVLSESMEAAFRPITRSMAPVQLGDPVRSLAIRQFPVVMDRPVPASIIPLIPGRFTENVQVEPAVASGTAEERPEPIDGAPAEEQEPQDESSAVSSQLSPQMQYMGSEIEEYFEEELDEAQRDEVNDWDGMGAVNDVRERIIDIHKGLLCLAEDYRDDWQKFYFVRKATSKDLKRKDWKGQADRNWKKPKKSDGITRDELRDLVLAGKNEDKHTEALEQLYQEEDAFLKQAEKDLNKALGMFPYKKMTYTAMPLRRTPARRR